MPKSHKGVGKRNLIIHMAIEELVKKVCKLLGTDPTPYDVTLRAFLIIREHDDLYKAYQALNFPDNNRHIGRLIKEHYGFTDAGNPIDVSEYILIKSFTPLKK